MSPTRSGPWPATRPNGSWVSSGPPGTRCCRSRPSLIAYLPAIAFIGIVALLPQGPDPAVGPHPRTGSLLRLHHRGHHPVRRPGRPRGPVPGQALPLPRRLSVVPAQPFDLPAGQGHRRGRGAAAGHRSARPLLAARSAWPCRTPGREASPTSWARWARSWWPACRSR